MKDPLKQGVQFLRALRPKGPWCVSAIKPDTDGVPTRTFIGTSELEAMHAWLAEMNTTHNLYFVANPVKTRINKRPREVDISHFQYAVRDFDRLKDESIDQCETRVMAKLKKFWPAYTAFWPTGNGFQVAWKIRPAVALASPAVIASCKLVCRGLVEALGGDTTISMEHLYRIPGTTNFPNESKRKRGYVKVRPDGFCFDSKVSCDVFELPRMKPPQKSKHSTGLVKPIGGWNTRDGINNAILYCQTTNYVAREGVSGTAIRTCLKCRDYGVSAEKAFDIMWEHWMPRCEYEWQEDELRDKISRAYKFAANDPGCLTAEYVANVEFKDAL